MVFTRGSLPWLRPQPPPSRLLRSVIRARWLRCRALDGQPRPASALRLAVTPA
jgi:hypothetical protein